MLNVNKFMYNVCEGMMGDIFLIIFNILSI